MWRTEWDSYVRLINDRVAPATGCTEPVSTALAAAEATRILGKAPEQIEVLVSGNLLKNGMGVGIPGTGEIGLHIAAALGAVCGNPDRGLEVLGNVAPNDVEQARTMVKSDQVSVRMVDTDSKLYAEVICHGAGSTSSVVIKDGHTNMVRKTLNGDVLFSGLDSDAASAGKEEPELSVSAIFEFATQGDLAKLEFIMKAAELNSALTTEGLAQDYGLRIGKTLLKTTRDGLQTTDLMSQAMIRSAAASDARMGGVLLPAMSNSGSGNQGISATMPVVAVAETIGASREQLTRALIMSHLTAIHIKSHMSVLSALCAATTAAAGASAAITWLLGGTQEHLESALFNMTGDVTGILCDGAGSGCSLKVSTSAQSAVKAAFLAVEGIRLTSHEGIIEDSVEGTIDNIGLIANQGLEETDNLIIRMMAR
ncbi:serine dehydratase subunit alpha family protein [Endozoicomonas ascidiicola]|uniref:L-cysteine desulfidase family protein n=1 Tax=Endozoicomonas ascidiicola TaxID=1698521 RepID=UPI00083587B3|nr:L-serine ammonia-lyase, iron-sulfur-dependent, subunit alpha [Endozoicomonas ascidiicola]